MVISSMIGKEFLSRFVVTLNYPAGEMLLVPSDGDKPRDNVFTTGIGVVRDASGKAIVSGVWSGSPADRLGIMARDEIAAINGKPASDYTLHALREILKQDDGIEAVDFVIRNSQGEKRLTIRKEYLFEASKKSRSTKTQQVGN
jgi:S1-C subfamily serine protease